MTPEELETIKIAIDNGLEINDEALKLLLSHIKELESQIPRWIPVEEKTTYLWAIPVFGIPGSVTVDFKRMTQEEGEKVWGAKIVPDSEKEES